MQSRLCALVVRSGFAQLVRGGGARCFFALALVLVAAIAIVHPYPHPHPQSQCLYYETHCQVPPRDN